MIKKFGVPLTIVLFSLPLALQVSQYLRSLDLLVEWANMVGGDQLKRKGKYEDFRFRIDCSIFKSHQLKSAQRFLKSIKHNETSKHSKKQNTKETKRIESALARWVEKDFDAISTDKIENALWEGLDLYDINNSFLSMTLGAISMVQIFEISKNIMNPLRGRLREVGVLLVLLLLFFLMLTIAFSLFFVWNGRYLMDAVRISEKIWKYSKFNMFIRKKIQILVTKNFNISI